MAPLFEKSALAHVSSLVALAIRSIFHALKIGDAAIVIPVTASYPLVTVLLATVFLGEPISLSRLFGAALIVAGIYFIR
jgi:transporter family protein